MHGLIMPCLPFLLQMPGSLLAMFPMDWFEKYTHLPAYFGNYLFFSLAVAVTQFIVLLAAIHFRYRHRAPV